MALFEDEPKYSLNFFPSFITVSPPLCSNPENKEPHILKSAPPQKALAISDEYLCPPSAIILPTPISFATPCAESAHSMTAESCGYPTPVIFLVVHAEPGPIPIFTISAPAKIISSVISFVTTFPAIIICLGHIFLTSLITSRKFCKYPFGTSRQINEKLSNKPFFFISLSCLISFSRIPNV